MSCIAPTIDWTNPDIQGHDLIRRTVLETNDEGSEHMETPTFDRSEAELAAADEEEAREAEAEAEAHARTEEKKAREEALYQRWRLRRLLETMMPPAQPYQHHGVQFSGLRG
ncbi:hypothetical protein BJ546DRAFT_1070854 [Cryomyces antarcticus]